MEIYNIAQKYYINKNVSFGMNISSYSSEDFKTFSELYIKGGYKKVVNELNKIKDTENDTIEFSSMLSKPFGFYYRFNGRYPVYLFKIPDALSKIPHNSLDFPVNIIKNSFSDYFEKNLKRL